MEPDLREVVLTYLLKLPQTIRVDMLLFVSVYAAHAGAPTELDQFEPRVTEFLGRSGMAGIGAVICTVAVVDHTFVGQEEKFDNAEIALKHLVVEKPDFPQDALMSLPMRRRHWRQAAETWQALRRSSLSTEGIRKFADDMLMCRRSV